MLAALGLGRLERELSPHAITTTDVDELLAQADAVDMHTLAREGMPEALEYLHWRQARGLSDPPPTGRHALPRHAAPLIAVESGAGAQTVLPVRIHAHSRVNPQFKFTGSVNRV